MKPLIKLLLILSLSAAPASACDYGPYDDLDDILDSMGALEHNIDIYKARIKLSNKSPMQKKALQKLIEINEGEIELSLKLIEDCGL